jgi:hypothetical protein
MKYHGYQQGIEEIIAKKKANLNALFYAVCSLVGVEIDPVQEIGNWEHVSKGSY